VRGSGNLVATNTAGGGGAGTGAEGHTAGVAGGGAGGVGTNKGGIGGGGGGGVDKWGRGAITRKKNKSTSRHMCHRIYNLPTRLSEVLEVYLLLVVAFRL